MAEGAVGGEGVVSEDKGASLRDRAAAVEPVPVSPLRDGIPSAEEIARVVAYIARAASDMSAQADVGGMETAGGFVSFLAANPERIPAFVNGGPCDIPPRFHVEGCLSWHGMDGKIHWPSDIRKRDGRHEH